MIKRALTLVNAQHITASVFINDDESGLHRDYEVWLEKVCSRLHPAPHASVAQPHRRGRLSKTDRSADAHLKRQIMGREVVVAVTDGGLGFGTWERIFYGEFDGRRRMRVLVKSRRHSFGIIGE
jgi:secondary thiamine-phosphate synthase enzyme